MSYDAETDIYITESRELEAQFGELAELLSNSDDPDVAAIGALASTGIESQDRLTALRAESRLLGWLTDALSSERSIL